MKVQIIYLLALLFLLTLNSCSKDWLSEKPSNQSNVLTELSDCQLLLDNTGLFNTGYPAISEISSDGHYIISTRIPALSDNFFNAYTWSYSKPYTSLNDWAGGNSGSYGRIFTCNLVLEVLEKIRIDASNEETWKTTKGQALFFRAKSYYELAQVFAPPFDESTADKELGIPLRLQSDVNLPTLRSTVKETYNRVINDLIESSRLLPLTSLYKTTPGKSAAFALLSRCYLSMEKYEGAMMYADSALNIYNKLLDYNRLNSNASYPIPLFNDEVIFHSTLSAYSENLANARVDTAVIALYNANDLRSRTFFTLSGNQYVFKGHYYGNRLCFNGLATDELYLIRAECYARANKVSEAMADLNTLLKNRWDSSVAYIPIAAENPEEALRKVLLERRKELLFRGLRWSDLRRLNRDPRFAITITRVVNGTTYKLEPNSYKYTFPIPDDIIQITGIEQNPGWKR